MDGFTAIIPSESAVILPRFQTRAGENIIALSRIVYLRAQLNYTVFHLSDGEQVMTSLSLSTYARLLEPQGFVRLHKSWLLNLHYLAQCREVEENRLLLPDGEQVGIARRRRKKVRKLSDKNHRSA